MGSIYKRGGVYWIKYYRRGRPFRESCGKVSTYDDAKRILAEREGDIAKGIPVSSRHNRMKIDELVEDLKNEYILNRRRSLMALEVSIKHLKHFFGGMKASNVTTSDIRDYSASRQEEEASNATINRELAHLKRAFNLARQSGKLYHIPFFPMLKESNVRKGFFEKEQLDSLLKYLPDHIKPVIKFAYITGWRTISEVLPLQWRNVDFSADVITLDPGVSKNEQPRVFPMVSELRRLLEAQKISTDGLNNICPWVFHKNGKPFKSYRKTWAKACVKAGLPGKIPHDFRRTAVRNLVRAGIPERVAMQMTGHKTRTRSVFERYNIVSKGDLTDAGRKLEEFSGTITDTIRPFQKKTRILSS